ncbi:olfactory receptor 14J1-like [Ammospiza nelsoni]|uniref:olfactory receptor 14J1-like n=1 Tax=Ammospiza nelsoni TaxID=2857394 RepID=UPI00286C3CB9|nr:olfactory receptor 14J1-like [Ammospiza nelsoni]
MCYDRYMSICKPLHYGTHLGSRACAHRAAAAWASAFLYSLLHTANTFSLPLCHGNVLGQLFCEIPQILKLSCSKSYLREFGPIAVSACLVFGCFVFTVFSYTQIFRAVLRIPSEQGRHKAFSTCLPHLAVVSLFFSTALFAHLKPPSMSSPSLDLALSVLYSVVPPEMYALFCPKFLLKAHHIQNVTCWLKSKETILTLRKLLEPEVHCDIEGPHGILEAMMALGGLIESRGCAGPHRTKETRLIL